jgi:NAD(P)-dependent dehydrogenase (short-subunit alcohol dehydrogenase family)
MRLEGKTAVIMGAGQAPTAGDIVGNGRATALTFAREGAKVLCVDRHLDSAQATAAMIVAKGGIAEAAAADVTVEPVVEAAMAACMAAWGRLDILHNNVGLSVEAGDAPMEVVTQADFARIMDVNLFGCVLACRHALPMMRAQRSGAIINISSASAYWTAHPTIAYPASKAAMITFTRQLAMQNAEYGVRANAILPGLMNTPMAVDRRMENTGRSRVDIEAERNGKVPLQNKMGDAWDVANAALFLASDEARFISGIELPVDGASMARVG